VLDRGVVPAIGEVDRVNDVIRGWAPRGAEAVVDVDRVRFLAPGLDVVVSRLSDPVIDDAVTKGTDPVHDVVVWACAAS